MKTPLPYYGGKQRLAKRICELMPAHTCYVEPFAGGLAVLFEKGYPKITNNDQYREVVNDLDGEIVKFWRELQDPNSDLHHRLKYTLFSREEHALSKKEKTAWGTWISTVQSFGNVRGDSWRVSKPTDSRATLCNDVCTFMNKRDLLMVAHERFRGCYIEHDDALTVIQRWDTPYTLHYCDPPYPGTDTSAYEGNYTLKDLQNLVDLLAECKGSTMLSNYPQEGLIVPDDWKRYEFESGTTMSSTHKQKSKRTEVLWVRDRSYDVLEDQRRYMWTPSKT